MSFPFHKIITIPSDLFLPRQSFMVMQKSWFILGKLSCFFSDYTGAKIGIIVSKLPQGIIGDFVKIWRSRHPCERREQSRRASLGI